MLIFCKFLEKTSLFGKNIKAKFHNTNTSFSTFAYSSIKTRQFPTQLIPYFQIQATRTFCIKMSGGKPQIIFVLGGPGAGKGTQCQKIVDQFGFVHLSAGDLLREERSREGSQYGEMIENCIRNGLIVPVEVTCSLLENAINYNMKDYGKKQFLIDGFPRNQDNLDGWNRQMADKVDFLFVLFFDCAQDICVQRCLERGKSGSGRSDDNEESMKKRIQTYTNDSLPIIEHYRTLNKVRQIDASPSADAVFKKVKETFNEIKGAGDY